MPDSNLSVSQKEQFRMRWSMYGLTLEQGLMLRRKAFVDLFFLGKELLGYHKLTETAHREVCDFFVKKDPDSTDFEAFAKAYEGKHERLLFLPRGGYKSTIDICDNVQWIIVFPDIRINVMTDRLDLAQEFVSGTKRHFTLNDDGTPREINGKPSLFQILFPEHCAPGKGEFSGNTTPQWTTPARTNFRVLGPTIRAAAIDAGKTGTHCDLLKIDDAITPESVGTGKSVGTNLRNITQKISMARNLRERYGFTDMIGTPQHGQDYLCQVLENEKKLAKHNRPANVATLVRPAAKLKDYVDPKPPVDEWTEETVDMWCPEVIALGQIQQEWSLPGGRDTVATQLLLDVSLKSQVKFKLDELIAATKPWQAIPRDGLMVIPFDLAYSTTSAADYTVGLPGMISGGRVYVVDMVRGKFDEFELPKVIATLIYKWRPQRVAIENSQGAKWLDREIRREMEKLGYQVNIEYVTIGKGTWKRNEVNAGPTVRLLGDKRLIFSAAIPELQSLYEELTNFPNPNHKDDIVSALNMLCNHFVTAEQLTVQETSQPTSLAKEKLLHEMMHGYGRGTPMVPQLPRVTAEGYGLLEPILGDLPE